MITLAQILFRLESAFELQDDELLRSFLSANQGESLFDALDVAITRLKQKQSSKLRDVTKAVQEARDNFVETFGAEHVAVELFEELIAELSTNTFSQESS
jgi:ATP-dependent helicase/DNAse subunit B